MKKNIIIAAIAAASALLLSVSCQKENQPESQNGINGGANTFTATIEQSLTKTILNGNKVEWADGDKISINGKIYTASPKDGAATKADFTPEDEEATAEGGKFKAFFPSSLYEAADRFVLPDTLNIASDNFNVPMYAETESSSQTLSFKNICAVLKINVTEADIAAIKSIKVKADKPLSGEFTISPEGDKAVMDNNGSNEVVLSFETVQTLTSSAKSFYIAIPAQEYSYLKIYLSDDGTLYKRAMITKKAEGLGTISVNTIYEINYETNAVQLYADGPYWSTMNLGATTVAGSGETCYGDYYAWGETQPYYATKTWNDADKKWVFDPWKEGKESGYAWQSYCGQSSFSEWPTKPFDDTSKNLTGAFDAATVNWGDAWKMPTGGNNGQFKALQAHTISAWAADYDGVAGRKVSGKDDYSDIELFIPIAGEAVNDHTNNTLGFYWSSSMNTYQSEGLFMYVNSGEFQPVFNGNRFRGLSVRPVAD